MKIITLATFIFTTSLYSGTQDIYEKTDQIQSRIKTEIIKRETSQPKYLAKKHKKIYPLLICAAEMIEDNYADGDSYHAGMLFLEYLEKKNFDDLKVIEKRCEKMLQTFKNNYKRSHYDINTHAKSDFEIKFKNTFKPQFQFSDSITGVSILAGAVITLGGGFYKETVYGNLGLCRKAYQSTIHYGFGLGAGIVRQKAKELETICMLGPLSIIEDDYNNDSQPSCGLGLFLLGPHAPTSNNKLRATSHKHHKFEPLLAFLDFE